jgi:hypothetical protein
VGEGSAKTQADGGDYLQVAPINGFSLTVDQDEAAGDDRGRVGGHRLGVHRTRRAGKRRQPRVSRRCYHAVRKASGARWQWAHKSLHLVGPHNARRGAQQESTAANSGSGRGARGACTHGNGHTGSGARPKRAAQPSPPAMGCTRVKQPSPTAPYTGPLNTKKTAL